MIRRALLSASFACLVGGSAGAQQNVPVYATGLLTPGHALVLQQAGTPGAGVVKDAGPAIAGNFTELGITNNGTPLCIRDLANQHILCFGALALGGGLISYNPIGNATPLGLLVNVNGVNYPFPGAGNGNVLGPPSSVANHIATYADNTGGVLKDAGSAGTALTGPLVSDVARNRSYLYLPAGYNSATQVGLIITPDGSVPANLNSTCSGGFNELELLDFQQGWSTEVRAMGEYSGEGSASPKSYLQTNCTNGFQVQPLANRSLTLATQLIGINSAATLNIDSMIKGKIICQACEIAATPAVGNAATTIAVYINPHTPIPNENITTVADSEIDLGNLTCAPTTGTGLAGVVIDLGLGGFDHNYLHANEFNNGGPGPTPRCLYDYYVFNSHGGTSYSGNLIDVNHVHLTQTAAVQIGEPGTTNGNEYTGNLYRFGSILPGSNGAYGVRTNGQNENFVIGVSNAGETQTGAPLSPFYTYAPTGGTNPINNTVEIALTNGYSQDSGAGSCSSIVDNTNWLNNYTLNGQTCSRLTISTQINELPVTSLVSGSGPAASCGTSFGPACTNHRGTIVVGGGNPAQFTINFSVPFRYLPNCSPTAGANLLTFYRSGNTGGPGAWTGVIYSTNGGTTMAAGTQIDYRCE